MEDEEQRLLKLRAPRLWEEFCDELQRATQEDISFQRVPPSAVRLRKKGPPPATLSVEFDENANRIRYECGAGRGEYLFLVDPDGTVVIGDAYHRRFKPKEMADNLLEMLTASPF